MSQTMIGSAHIAQYLVANGIVDTNSIVGGQLSITVAQGRNYNFIVDSDKRSLLFKQALWLEENQKATGREIRFYERALPGLPSALAARIPALVFADEAGGTLAVEFVANASPMFQIFRDEPLDVGAVDAARQLGEFLGDLHGASPCVPASDAGLPDDAPWAFRAHEPTLREFGVLSHGAYNCLKLLQQNQALCQYLDRASAAWKADVLIHADIKSDNLLYANAAGDGDTPAGKLHVVDWESVQLGDAAWDIAGFLQDIILYWLFSIPLLPGASVAAAALQARCPILALVPALGMFVRAYGSRSQRESLRTLLPRAASMTAVRLTQFALEFAHQHNSLLPQSLMALRVAEGMTRSPDWVSMLLRGEQPAFGRP
jgi:aminoglycoside phosphotransferase (APT) family kinase protein